jgi:hypothetical protein
MPGVMRECSIPSSTKIGHKMSRNATAVTSNGRLSLGSTRLAAKATAKWPTNMAAAYRGFAQKSVRGIRRPEGMQRKEMML